MPRLDYVLTGIKQVQAKSGSPPKPCLPIMPVLLLRLRAVWLSSPVLPDQVMLWAAACRGFFGFLRAGEFTVPTARGYDPDVHLSLQDLAIESHTATSLVRLRIKQSKTDPLRQGVDIFLGATNSDICPVQALILYLALLAPFFFLSLGLPLLEAPW